jgi:hypothetical protein
MKHIAWGGAFLFLATLASASGPEPLYWPTCPASQNIAPMQWSGSQGQGYRSAMAWNGADYALAWADGSYMVFRRFFTDGTPATGIVPIGNTCDSPPAMVWTGDGYAVAMQQWNAGLSRYDIYFVKLNLQGTVTYGPVQVSHSTGHTYFPGLAWSGSGFAIVWADPRNGAYDIYGTLLNADGTVNIGDIAIATASEHQTRPTIAYSRSGGRYQLVWEDYRNVSTFDLYGCQLDRWGTVSNIQRLVVGSNYTYAPALVDCGSGFGLAWSDNDTGIRFCRISGNGYKVGADVVITLGRPAAVDPQIAWTGMEYGVIWADGDGINTNILLQRVSASGAPAGGIVQLTETIVTERPSLAFGQYGYLVSGGIPYHAYYLWSIGCNWDGTPPTCPGNLLAYNITGTTATVSWLPSTEDYTDIAYYQVYKNNIPLAKTSSNYFSDSGLTPGGTYNYSVRPVNAAQMENGTCNSSVYVKADASLLLYMDKSAPDAHLFWTDGGLNNYNVFRGTNPQVMTLINSTSQQEAADPNVLMDGVTYFYTVDDPVQ